MFLQNLRAKVGARLSGEKSEAGFTLIELLVVMLILGILAAIAIPAFFNQREKATDAQAKAAARTAETSIETYATENGGSYVGATSAILHTIEPTLVEETKGNNEIKVSGLAAKTFKVESVSATGVGFNIERQAAGTVKFDCTNHGKSGCPSSGEWNK
ncbi:MAG TPA: type II secretion system protein [Candidatus Dormibacteraeota bacterium]